uniref:asparagine synthase (glutamine-hydrolyzing) n=1 Tax=Candidatus Kentrum eta TaxID=2126337 RepID=A0A450UNY4_9GAMM|nr:MAG: hypothetical protein BECKH772B_GA0070898_100588 [Candidatus Kentron sp. H]VFJ94820.1 MAG: hypothetical protein BECKH772A_GA0070896_100786 [Candidatus Kentron sp. H]VFK01920.1 MAG: hypothetical protein BECKH772C_GA0070978_100769 [Candidatus Kentron sp. H]
MCGIAGIIDYEKPLDRGVLEQMRATLRHRGPDGQGPRMLPHAGLAHTRLSLLHLARGSQPMRGPHGRYLVYFPLGFANESNFKSVLLIRNHASLV